MGAAHNSTACACDTGDEHILARQDPIAAVARAASGDGGVRVGSGVGFGGLRRMPWLVEPSAMPGTQAYLLLGCHELLMIVP